MSTVKNAVLDVVALPGNASYHLYRMGNGEPIVYLHGVGGVSEDDPVLLALGERWQVNAPLAPGFHDLTELENLDDIHDLALHYEEIIRSLGIAPVILVGHSFGGMVAAELAAHFPDLVSHLVLISPFGLWNDLEPVTDIFGMPVIQLARMLWVDPESPQVKAISAGVTKLDPEAISTQLIPVLQGFSAVAKFVWPIPEKGLRKRLHRIRARTLVLWGSEDHIIPSSYAQRFIEAIATSQLELIEGAGHMLPLERPNLLVERVAAFLEAESAGRLSHG